MISFVVRYFSPFVLFLIYRCSQTFPIDVAEAASNGKFDIALLGDKPLNNNNSKAVSSQSLSSPQDTSRASSFDPSRYRFVVSPTENTPGMIISSDSPLRKFICFFFFFFFFFWLFDSFCVPYCPLYLFRFVPFFHP